MCIRDRTQEDVDLIYKRKPRAPYRIAKFADGSEEKVWCTFDAVSYTHLEPYNDFASI